MNYKSPSQYARAKSRHDTFILRKYAGKGNDMVVDPVVLTNKVNKELDIVGNQHSPNTDHIDNLNTLQQGTSARHSPATGASGVLTPSQCKVWEKDKRTQNYLGYAENQQMICHLNGDLE